MARRKSRRAVARNGAALRAGADTAEIDVDDPHATRTGQKIRVLLHVPQRPAGTATQPQADR